MQGLARFAGWVGLLALVWFLGWKVVMLLALLAPGVTLGGVATTLLMVNVMAGALAFLIGVGLFVLYVLSESYGQPAPQRVMIEK